MAPFRSPAGAEGRGERWSQVRDDFRPRCVHRVPRRCGGSRTGRGRLPESASSRPPHLCGTVRRCAEGRRLRSPGLGRGPRPRSGGIGVSGEQDQSAGRRVLETIADQVGDCLLELARIRGEGQGGGDFDGDPSWSDALEQRGYLLDDPREIGRSPVQLERARLQARTIEEVADLLVETVELPVDHPEGGSHFLLGRQGCAGSRQPAIALHGGERIAQIVRDAGDEAQLGRALFRDGGGHGVERGGDVAEFAREPRGRNGSGALKAIDRLQELLHGQHEAPLDEDGHQQGDAHHGGSDPDAQNGDGSMQSARFALRRFSLAGGDRGQIFDGVLRCQKSGGGGPVRDVGIRRRWKLARFVQIAADARRCSIESLALQRIRSDARLLQSPQNAGLPRRRFLEASGVVGFKPAEILTAMPVQIEGNTVGSLDRLQVDQHPVGGVGQLAGGEQECENGQEGRGGEGDAQGGEPGSQFHQRSLATSPQDSRPFGWQPELQIQLGAPAGSPPVCHALATRTDARLSRDPVVGGGRLPACPAGESRWRLLALTVVRQRSSEEKV